MLEICSKIEKGLIIIANPSKNVRKWLKKVLKFAQVCFVLLRMVWKSAQIVWKGCQWVESAQKSLSNSKNWL